MKKIRKAKSANYIPYLPLSPTEVYIMTHVLIVVDMQNDFIDGILSNPRAQEIVPKVAELIRAWDGPVIATMDTHDASDWVLTPYRKVLRTEMAQLPVHCVKYTQGWLFAPEIAGALSAVEAKILEKGTFAVKDMWIYEENEVTSITLVGLCTDICVISNALKLVSEYPYKTVRVLRDLCAGTTPEKHEAALAVMASCLVDVTDSAHIRDILEAEVREREEYNL